MRIAKQTIGMVRAQWTFWIEKLVVFEGGPLTF